mgnify:CR=1 FL=1
MDVLNTGDSISYSVSANVRHGGQEAWVKFEATTTVREGETAEEARSEPTSHMIMVVLVDRMTPVQLLSHIAPKKLQLSRTSVSKSRYGLMYGPSSSKPQLVQEAVMPPITCFLIRITPQAQCSSSQLREA